MNAQSDFDQLYGSRPLLVCFSHLRWNFVYQRPQHLLSRAARSYDVAFMEEPLREDTVVPKLRREVSRERVVVLTPIIPHAFSEEQACDAQQALLEAFLEDEQRGLLIFWYYTPAALAFSSGFTPDVIVYDCMDELAAFKMAPPSLRVFERELFRLADVVFTGGHSLYEAKRPHHHNVHAFPSSIDASHFGRARSRPPCPADIAELRGPRLGFFGVIDERMDLNLLSEMAAIRPDWQFVMIGPVVKVSISDLPQAPNLHWIGGRDYSELPEYISAWDVGLMPFAMNESTRFISPTKTPEFLAAGCPVVSTPITDVVTPYGVSGLVEIASTAQEAVECAERLMRRDKTSWLAAVDAQLSGNSWDRTWEQMNAHLQGYPARAVRELETEAMIGAARV